MGAKIRELSTGVRATPPRLCIQEMFPIVDELCKYDQCRLTGAFVEAEDLAMKTISKFLIKLFITLSASVEQMRAAEFLDKTRYLLLKEKQSEVGAWVNNEMQLLGYKDGPDFVASQPTRYMDLENSAFSGGFVGGAFVLGGLAGGFLKVLVIYFCSLAKAANRNSALETAFVQGFGAIKEAIDATITHAKSLDKMKADIKKRE